jgi:hypothetical protein
MPVELTHDNVRDIAKNVRELTGRDVKHTAIIEAIATALGKRPDVLMHQLKCENVRPGASSGNDVSPAEVLTSTGLTVATASDGQQWFTARLIETRIQGWASLDIFVFAVQDQRRTISGTADEAVWIVEAKYSKVGGMTMWGDEPMTLSAAVSKIYEYANRRHFLWQGTTMARIDHDLDETNPLLFSKVENRQVRPREDSSRQLRHARSYGLVPGVARTKDGEIDCFQAVDRYIDTAVGPKVYRTRVLADGSQGVLSDMHSPIWKVEFNIDHGSTDGGITSVLISGVNIDDALYHAAKRENDKGIIEAMVRAHRTVKEPST